MSIDDGDVFILHFFNYYNFYTGSFYPKEKLSAGHEAFRQVFFWVIDAKLFGAAGNGQEERAQNASVDG